MSITASELTFDPAVAMARQALYRFAALTLLDPKFGSWEKLVDLRDDAVLSEAAALLCDLPEAIPEELAPGERSLAELDVSAVLAGACRTPMTSSTSTSKPRSDCSFPMPARPMKLSTSTGSSRSSAATPWRISADSIRRLA